MHPSRISEGSEEDGAAAARDGGCSAGNASALRPLAGGERERGGNGGEGGAVSSGQSRGFSVCERRLRSAAGVYIERDGDGQRWIDR